MQFKTFFRYLAYGLGALALAAFFGFWWLWVNLPTTAPQSISALPSNSTIQGRCLMQHPQFAYQVQVQLHTQSADQTLHQSTMEFTLHFAARGETSLAGVATDIRFRENQQPQQSIDNLLFLAKADAEQAVVFSAFNALALPSQHPMKVLSQVLKNLSLGDSAQVYRFAYDELQRIYRYQHNGQHWQRTVSAPGQMNSQILQPIWQVQVQDCLPESLQSQETQPLKIGDKTAQFSIQIRATRIAPVMDLSQLHFAANANSKHHWQAAAMDLNESLPKIDNDQQAWQILARFETEKNIAALLQASAYLIEHLPARSLADHLLNNSDDNTNRDLIFGLGLLKSNESAQYLIDLMHDIPSGQTHAELQKVRIMVALSTHHTGGEAAYQALTALYNDPQESSNIRNNALINMGSTVKNLTQQQQSTQTLRADLTQRIQQQLTQPDASAALFASANLGDPQLNHTIEQTAREKLKTGTQKERFAAAMLLAQDASKVDELLAHLRTEPSKMVKQAIQDGLAEQQLTAAQRTTLHALLQ